MAERIWHSRRAQRMGADLKSELCRIRLHEHINAVRSDRPFEPPPPVGRIISAARLFLPIRAVTADRTEQRTVFIGAVPGGVEIVVNERVGAGMQRKIARLAAFAGDDEMRHAPSHVAEISDLELA
jgi:hypothetical protein